MRSVLIKIFVVVAVAAILIVAAIQWNRMCTTVTATDPVMGSHGWGVWFDETFQVFDHNEKRICVPEGWASVGSVQRGSTWAKFPKDQSAILVRPETFGTYDLTFAESAYRVRVVYPIEMNAETLAPYLVLITNAFEKVGALYPNATDPREHTVFVSVGLLGDGMDFESTLYPEPGPTVSTFARAYQHVRSDELLIHAVAHLYNRHRPDLIAYEQAQSPIPSEDFQEMEASWVEVYARSTNEGRAERLDQLYAVHAAVQSNAYAPDLLYPFSEREYFDGITQKNVVLPADAPYSDFQYGHYILAPLSMVAIDGLLSERKAPVRVADILTTIHENPDTNLFSEAAKYLTPEDMQDLTMWMRGEKLIPRGLIERGNAVYKGA